MVEEKGQKFGQGSPPPFFGQCPKENIFFTGGLPLHPLFSPMHNVYIGHSIIIYRERIGLNTDKPSLSTEKDYPVHSLMMNRMAVLHQNLGVIGKSTPTLEISLVSGNLLGIGDGFPNTSLVLMEHGYNIHGVHICIFRFSQ